METSNSIKAAMVDIGELQAENVTLRSRIAELEAENKRMVDIAGEALGFSEYQRDQDTVEVLANHCKRLAEELAAVKGELDASKQIQTMEKKILIKEIEENKALRARCERLVEGTRQLFKYGFLEQYPGFMVDFKKLKAALELFVKKQN